MKYIFRIRDAAVRLILNAAIRIFRKFFDLKRRHDAWMEWVLDQKVDDLSPAEYDAAFTGWFDDIKEG